MTLKLINPTYPIHKTCTKQSNRKYLFFSALTVLSALQDFGSSNIFFIGFIVLYLENDHPESAHTTLMTLCSLLSKLYS